MWFDLAILGVYNMEAVNDYTWNTIAYSASIFYHFVFLQIVAIVSIHNLLLSCYHLVSNDF